MNIMNLSNMFYFMVENSTDLCHKMRPVWTIFGYIIFAVKIVVPLLLIITGMIALAQAVMSNDEKEIKKAQKVLTNKLILAVLVFLVVTITGVVVGLVTNEDWKDCADCAFSPFGTGCWITDPGDTPIHGGGSSTGGSTTGGPNPGQPQ